MMALAMVGAGGGLVLAAYIALCRSGDATRITATTADQLPPPEGVAEFGDEGEAPE